VSARFGDAVEGIVRREAGADHERCRDERGASDAGPAVKNDAETCVGLFAQRLDEAEKLLFGFGRLAVGDGEAAELHACGAAEGALLREIELLILIVGQQRDEDFDTLAVERADLILQPVATARAGGGCEMERRSRVNPVRHRLGPTGFDA
jgi:hypothetical protein